MSKLIKFLLIYCHIVLFLTDMKMVFGHFPNAGDGSTIPPTFFTDPVEKCHPNTTLLLIGTRHGHRNPAQFLPTYKNSTSAKLWGMEGEMELTSIGKQQSYALGQSLRRFIINDSIDPNFLQYKPDRVEAHSSSARRCQMTLQLVLAGLYPPMGYRDWSEDIKWSPIPYTVNDTLLRMYTMSADQCPLNAKVWRPISDENLPEFLHILKNARNNLISYAATETGWNGSVATMAVIADNIDSMIKFNASLPDWVTKSPFGSEANMTADLLEFLEMPTATCARLQPCRDLMGGVWLGHILDKLSTEMAAVDPFQDEIETRFKTVLYASHSEVTLSVMKLLEIDKIDKVQPAAGFLLEYRDRPYKAVRILTHNPDKNNQTNHPIYQAVYGEKLAEICSADHWCPAEDFLKLLTKKTIKNWREKCENQMGNCDKNNLVNGGNLVVNFLGRFTTGLCVGFSVIVYSLRQMV